MTDVAAKRRRSTLLFVRDLLIIVLVAIVISFVIKTFLVRTFFVPSGSMQTTLQIDDRILVNELVPELMPLQRGDVVVFEDPGGWLPASPASTLSPLDSVLSFIGLAPQDGNNHLVKRVIGLPGDTVECCDSFGHLIINGVPVTESYITLDPGQTSAGAHEFSITVPANSIWVMGDNRDHSRDSSFHLGDPGGGAVPISRVVGRAIVVSWPVSHWAWLDNHPDDYLGVK